MFRRLLLGLALLVALVLIVAVTGLIWAHIAIRRERAALPAPETIAASAGQAGGPVRLAMINTASQPMSRGTVLDPKQDPHPDGPYVMSHPSFVLEWADGRMLLVDVGMNAEEALSFGKPLELVAGAAPIVPHGSTAERLGDARKRVHGVIFTHLHTDHVGGIVDLCAAPDKPLSVFMTPAQAERPNYTTRPGRSLLKEASCVREVVLSGGPLMPVPGFPGIFVVATGGHTPGSQMIVANMAGGAKTYLFAGDIANNIDGIREDIPKPYLYSLLMVPEDTERLGELRRFIRDQGQKGVVPLVSHDELHLVASGVPEWKEHPAD